MDCAERGVRIPDAVRDHPFVTILALALLARLVLMPLLTYDYDIYHWGLIIENIQSGNGLYDTAGYYYTPVWGYILGSMSAFMDAFLNVDVFGVRFTELFPVENLICKFHIATATTIGFNLFIKSFLVMVDFAVALLLFKLTEERTSDRGKAMTASALWLFSLPVIYMSAIQAQFDSISAFLLLLTVYLIYKDHTFVGGMVFAISVLLKFFPAFCIIVFIGYVWAKHRDDGLAVRKVASAVIGAALMASVLVMPQVLDGTWSDALSFVTGRMDRNTNLAQAAWSYMGMFVMVAGMLLCGWLMIREREDIDRRFFELTMMALVLATVTALTPQYFMVFLPLLCLYIADGGRRLIRCWALITFGAFFAAITINNMSLLLSLSEFTGLVSPGWVVSAMQWMESIGGGDFTLVSVLNCIGNIIQLAGLVFLVLIYFREHATKICGRIGPALDWMSGEYEGQEN